MKVEWKNISKETPRFCDLKDGEVFVIPGNDGIYIKTSSYCSGDGINDKKIGVTELERGDFFYMLDTTHINLVNVKLCNEE